MADIDCKVCENLEENVPEFIQNGITNAMCTSLKNDTGLKASLNHNDCTDLDAINDCTIGLMDDKLEGVDQCDWKEYMHRLVPNIYNMFKAIICAICGLWTNIHTLWENITEIWCWLEHLTTTTRSYSIRAYDDQGNPINGFRMASGVHIVSQQDDPTAIPINIRAKGSVAFVNGSVMFDGNLPTTYTNGDTVAWTSLRQGSATLTNKDGVNWGKDGICGNISPFVYEIQFKKCQLGFSDFFGRAYLIGPDYMFRLRLWKAGDWVAPDWQSEPYHVVNGEQVLWPDSYQFLPDDPDMMLLQVRLQHTRGPLSASRMTPGGNVDVIPCPNSWSC